MNANYNQIKDDLLRFCKRHHACKGEYKRLYIADNIEDIISVIKDNFNWCVKYNDFADVIKENEEQFAEHEIFINKYIEKEYCNAFILFTKGEYEISLWISSILNIWTLGDSKLHINVRGRSTLNIWSYNNSNIELVGYSHSNMRVLSFNDSSVNIRMYTQSYAHILAYDSSLVHIITNDNANVNLFPHGNSNCYISTNNDSTAIVIIYDESKNTLISNHRSTIVSTCNDLFKDSETNVLAYDNSTMIIKTIKINCVKKDDTASLIIKK